MEDVVNIDSSRSEDATREKSATILAFQISNKFSGEYFHSNKSEQIRSQTLDSFGPIIDKYSRYLSTSNFKDNFCFIFSDLERLLSIGMN
jgi:hypothetical protein